MKRPFDEIDPFNPQNEVEGYIYMDERRYGDLLIEKVNGKPCRQYIHTTPKFYYPYRAKSMHTRDKFSIIADELRIYEKIDGSNIFVYEYEDADGKTYKTYKTRLSPFVKNNRFYPLRDLLIEAGLPVLAKPGTAFEMYGNKCKVLIEYDVPVALTEIFRLDKEGNLYPPERGALIEKIYGPIHPTVLEELYVEYEKRVERRYVENGDTEGVMFYCRYGDRWEAYKCKSKSAVSDNAQAQYVSYGECYTTMINATELVDDEKELIPMTKRLLRETYGEAKIEHPKTQKHLQQALKFVTLRKRVLEKYEELKCTNMPDKADKLRALAPFFDKRERRLLYGLLDREGLL